MNRYDRSLPARQLEVAENESHATTELTGQRYEGVSFPPRGRLGGLPDQRLRGPRLIDFAFLRNVGGAHVTKRGVEDRVQIIKRRIGHRRIDHNLPGTG